MSSRNSKHGCIDKKWKLRRNKDEKLANIKMEYRKQKREQYERSCYSSSSESIKKSKSHNSVRNRQLSSKTISKRDTSENIKKIEKLFKKCRNLRNLRENQQCPQRRDEINEKYQKLKSRLKKLQGSSNKKFKHNNSQNKTSKSRCFDAFSLKEGSLFKKHNSAHFKGKSRFRFNVPFFKAADDPDGEKKEKIEKNEKKEESKSCPPPDDKKKPVALKKKSRPKSLVCPTKNKKKKKKKRGGCEKKKPKPYKPNRPNKKNKVKKEKINDSEENLRLVQCKMDPFCFNVDRTKEIMKLFLEELEKGLSADTNADAKLKCTPTYIQDLPTREETGSYLAVDLTGNQFRTLYLELKDGSVSCIKTKEFEIPVQVMTGQGVELFDFIAEGLSLFIKENKLEDGLPLGFTFNFKVVQSALNSAVLEAWTGGYKAEGVEGEDVVAMLSDAIGRRDDITVEVMVLLYDPIGTMISLAFQDLYCKIGVNIGTTSNACYLETLENATVFAPENAGSGNIVIDIGWAYFGDDGVLAPYRTDYDAILDCFSQDPGKKTFEKMISSTYLGELARLAILECTRKGFLFKGSVQGYLEEVNVMKTRHLNAIESDPFGCFTKCKEVMCELGIKCICDDDCKCIRLIAEHITKRSAALLSAAIAVLIKKVGMEKVTVAIDGDLFKQHPHYKNYMLRKLKDIVEGNIRYTLKKSDDGSGRGAAILAATIKTKMNRPPSE